MPNITLYDNHQPSLMAGRYHIEIKQKQIGENTLDANSTEIDFEVAGEKYAINQLQIDSVFPPAGGMGDFSLVLPHIILNRSTLPWENETGDGKNTTPWLALLLFYEEEMSASDEKEGDKNYFVKHIAVSEWESAPGAKTSNQPKKEGQVSIIVCTNKKGWDSNILPTYDELPFCTHVRSTDNVEKAVVVCKRLPGVNKKNIVHLVSLESRFDSGSFTGQRYENNTAFVSLKSWEFFCNDHFIISEEVYDVYKKSQNQIPFDINLKDGINIGKEYFDKKVLIEQLPLAYKDSFQRLNSKSQTEADKENLTKIDHLLKTFRIGHLPDILKHLDRKISRLRLPDPNPEPEEGLLNGFRAGYVIIPYHLKTGKIIDAFYRGPMVPKTVHPVNKVAPLFHADKALQYIKKANKLDVSYAAAWELGKLLAIQNKNFSVALYTWKRACYQAIKLNKKKNNLKFPETNAVLPTPPPFVSGWFKNVKDLKGIPFDYLIPDPALIPFESIRFFEIDETWLRYLIDGAFSIGRISDAEKTHDQELYDNPGFGFLKTSNTTRSGFLLHSVAVAGWPDLVVYNNSEENVPYRKDKLSMNLLMCLFNEPIGTIGIHQKPESIHFGFEDQEAAKDGIAIKIKEFPKVADFANDLIQKVEVIQFTLS